MFRMNRWKSAVFMAAVTAVLGAALTDSFAKADSYTFSGDNNRYVYVASTTHNLKFWAMNGDPKTGSSKAEFLGELNFWWGPDGRYKFEIVTAGCGFMKDQGKLERTKKNFNKIIAKMEATLKVLADKPCGESRARTIDDSSPKDTTRERPAEPFEKVLFSVLRQNISTVVDRDFWSKDDY